ncbi:MAG: DsrE family protein [Chloroflexi bacterium]|nr:DsrE family protein [Chloroflexota bacterium]
MNALFIINDPPYGTERAYNALRLAYSLVQREDVHVRVFLIGDGASCAQGSQRTPNGYYNLERMISGVIRRGGEVAVCGSCMDARGLADTALIEGACRSGMDELTEWTLAADRVLTF